MYLDERPSFTHTMATVDCFNLPLELANGSNAMIHYKTARRGIVLKVASERPLLLPQTTATTNRTQPPSIAACLSVVYGRPPFVDSWLRYQRSIGVSHVHVVAETSFVLEGGLREAFFADSVRNGFISVDVWQPLLVSGVQIHYHSQQIVLGQVLPKLPRIFYSWARSMQDPGKIL